MAAILYEDLSDGQRKAVSQCLESIRRGERLIPLFGFAGTGKTTLASIIAGRSGLRYAFAAPTGKAARVLTSKGCPAATIHHRLYECMGEVRDEKGRREPWFEFDKKKGKDVKDRFQLLIIDGR